MTITIDDHSGFCFGVIHAIQTAEEYLKNHRSLYCLGDIVHNNEEVRRLTDIGLRVITQEQFRELKDTTVLIRAHGEPPATYEIAKANNITLIDATCPVVLRLQQRIRDFHIAAEHRGSQILIFGKKGHAEVVGLMGQAENQVVVLSSLADIDKIDFERPSMLYSQTTQSLELYYQLIESIKERYCTLGRESFFQYADTICRKVANRAEQIAQFARQHDVVLFVSGEKSSNGLYLFDVCKKNNPATYMVSQTKQLQEIDFGNANSVGICGATSTPMWLMQEFERCLL